MDSNYIFHIFREYFACLSGSLYNYEQKIRNFVAKKNSRPQMRASLKSRKLKLIYFVALAARLICRSHSFPAMPAKIAQIFIWTRHLRAIIGGTIFAICNRTVSAVRNRAVFSRTLGSRALSRRIVQRTISASSIRQYTGK